MKRIIYITSTLAALAITLLLWNNSIPKSTIAFDHKLSHRHSHLAEPLNYNKARAPIRVSVEKLEDGNASELLRLKGTVTVSATFQELKVVWAVPAGAEVLSGLTEELVQIPAGESKTFEILLRLKTSTNQKVFFQARTTEEINGRNLGSAAHYNTMLEPELKKQTQENFLKARAAVKAGRLRKIVF